MRAAIITPDIMAAPGGVVTTRDITVITPRIMRLITGVITRIIIHDRRHAERVR